MIGQLRLELGLVGAFLRRGSGPRAALIAACTAIVSGLLLVALTVVLFSFDDAAREEQLSGLIRDSGVRGGYLFAILLICIAPLTLLRQVVRLGTATREQRLAALRLAGATPAEVRRLGSLEVGLPALVGGLLGYVVFLGLRLVLGGDARGYLVAESAVARELRLVPVTVGPAWWQVLLVALGVAFVGVLAGGSATRSLTISPLGVSRRTPLAAPRPGIGLLLMALALPLAKISTDSMNDLSAVAAPAFLACLVLGLLALAPWIAYRAGRLVAARCSSAPLLMAGRRLATDARPAGRAAAAVGAITMVAGGGGAVVADLPNTGGSGFGGVDPFYTVPIALGGVVLVVALALVVFSMAVHGVESLLDHKRPIASLAVLGASTDELARAQRWEIGLVAMPMAVIGVLIGSVPMTQMIGTTGAYAWIPLLVDLAAVGLVWLAVCTSTVLTRPWLLRAAAPANLRTP